MKFKFSLLTILVLFTVISLVNAQPFTPSQQFTEGFTIKYPPFQSIQQAQPFNFHFHVYNISNGVPINISNSSITCHFHLYNSSGNHILRMEQKIVSDMFDYEFPVNGSSFTKTGYYAYVVQCDNLQQGVAELGGFESIEFQVVGASDGLDNRLFLVFLFLAAAGLLIFAVSTKNEYVGFMSGLLFMISGIYLISYGFGTVYNIYSQAIAYCSIGFGAIIGIAAGYKVTEELRSGQAW